MFADAQLQLSAAQAVTASAVSTNTIDLGVARDLGAADVNIVITVDVAATAAGAATVQFQIITSAAANLGSPTILAQTDAIPKTDLIVGRKPIILEIPRAILLAQPVGQRFLGLNYNVGTGPLTAGSFTANMVLDVQDVNKNYPTGYSIL